jgi:hypothetical protein
LAHVDVLGVEEGILVEGVVFGGGGVHPYVALFAFEEDSPAGVDGELAEGRIFEVVCTIMLGW